MSAAQVAVHSYRTRRMMQVSENNAALSSIKYVPAGRQLGFRIAMC